MISHKHKFAFAHIPKCGGVSIHNSFLEMGIEFNETGHKNFRAISQFNNIEDYFKFTFVRNPWSRVVSLYSFWKGQDKNHQFYHFDHKQVDYIKDNKLSFIDFVHLMAETHNVFHEKPHLYPYFYHYFSDDQNYDFVGKIETFQDSFEQVCKKLGYEAPKVKHSNKSKHKHYTEYYNYDTRKIVEKSYKEDINYFNYSFRD
jgi:chondroitin 4-sulfotransferase 11